MTEADAVRPVCGPGDCDRFDQIGRLGRLLTTGDIYADWDMDQRSPEPWPMC